MNKNFFSGGLVRTGNFEVMGRNGSSRAKIMVRLYGRTYSVISEKSECSTVRFYASIESRYGGNRFTVVVGIRNGNFFMAPTVCICTQAVQLDLL